MRGSPALHLFIVLLGFAVFAVPLAKLTFARPEIPHPHAVAPIHEVPAGKTKCVITVRFVQKPTTLSLKIGGKDEVTGLSNSPASPAETTAELVLPEAGLEVLASASWPQGSPEQALTVDIEPDGREALSLTKWSVGGQLNEVLTFHWPQ